MELRFARYHALGNDYLVVEGDVWERALDPRGIRLVCHRHFGLGSDGILLALDGGKRLRIFNPDGSEAEKSGNGLRIFARWLWDHGRAGDAPFRVATAGGEVECTVLAAGRAVAVAMGRASFRSEEVPVAGPPREALEEPMEIEGRSLRFSAVTVGNPHCVLFADRVSAEEARALGPRIETDARFPRRTNVQFAEVLDEANLRIEIWERGAGYTLASGTSACAAAAVARRLGRCAAAVTVHMPGGTLAVEVSPDFHLRMSGGVTRVAEGVLAPEALAQELPGDTA